MTILEATRRNVERRLQVAEQAELHRLAAEHEEAARDAAHRAVSAQEGLGHAHRTAERAAADTAATAEARRAAWERAESAAVERGSAALEEARRQWAEGPAGLEAVRGPRTRAQCGTRAQCAAGGRKAAGTAPRCRDTPCAMRLAGFGAIAAGAAVGARHGVDYLSHTGILGRRGYTKLHNAIRSRCCARVSG